MSLWLFTLSLLCFLTLSFAWYSFLPEASISLCKTTSRSNIPRGLLAMTSPKHFFTAAMEERLKRGVLTSGDLNRAFSFTKRDLDDFARKKYEGVVGVIFSLESVLVNLVPVMLYSFSILAEDLRKETPKEAQVRDILGMPFRDQLLALQWSVPKESEALVYTRFLQIFMRIADALPITPMPGAETLLDDLLRAGNEVTINSYLSREASIKAISKSGLSNVLEGRLGPDRLIFPSPDFPNTSQHRGQQLIRCCGVMRKPPV